MSNIQQNSSNTKPLLSIKSVCSKDCLDLKRVLVRAGFSKRSGVSVYTLLMVLISSIFTGAKSLHDRFTLASVDYPECSYYALMRFVSDSRYKWSNLLKLIAKVACSIIVKLNNKDHIYVHSVSMTLLLKEQEVNILKVYLEPLIM